MIQILGSMSWNIFFGILKRGEKLEEKYCNHKLHGIWLGYCECHVRPDILLIYEIDKQNKRIYIDRLGSHSDLF